MHPLLGLLPDDLTLVRPVPVWSWSRKLQQRKSHLPVSHTLSTTAAAEMGPELLPEILRHIVLLAISVPDKSINGAVQHLDTQDTLATLSRVSKVRSESSHMRVG
jgi:hypothetical protein